MEVRSSQLEVLAAISVVLLVYSGLIKWIPYLPVDLTVVAFIMTLMCAPLCSARAYFR